MKLGYIYRKAFSQIDRLTDSLTSYKLVYFVLLAILGWAVLAALLGVGSIPYKWYNVAISAGVLVAVCFVVNIGLSRFLNIASNKDSYLITALILSLIMTPAVKLPDYYVLVGAGALAITSKYVLTFRRAHIFNPAAFAAFLMGAIFHKYAGWWVGTSILTPVVFVGGWLILRKMKRYTLVTVFLAVYLALMLFHSGTTSISHDWHLLWIALVETQILFFAYIMLTEPMTSPTVVERYIPYAVLVALVYGSIYWHIGSWQPGFSPEQALLIGNVSAFIFAFSPRYKLKLTNKIHEADGIMSFVYARPESLKFKAGQYMEWTLPDSKSDSRGNRRYLTVASSPTEKDLMITLRMADKKSWYKQNLEAAGPNAEMLASRIAGSFTLPSNRTQKMAFLAGGVGITPFRSMIKYMLDSDDTRDVSLLYAVNTPKEVAYKELLTEAKRRGIKPYIVVSDPPAHWGGLKGYVDEKVIKQTLPDYKERQFYVSGPLPFVSAMEKELFKMGVSSSKIKTDYFPGYA